MRMMWALFLSFLLPSSCITFRIPAESQATIVFTHAMIVGNSGERHKLDMAIVISDSAAKEIGEADKATGQQPFRGKGNQRITPYLFWIMEFIGDHQGGEEAETWAIFRVVNSWVRPPRFRRHSLS